MAEYEKKVRKIMLQNGCTFVRRGKGDHDIWYSPITNRNITVDTKIKSRQIADSIIDKIIIEIKKETKDSEKQIQQKESSHE